MFGQILDLLTKHDTEKVRVSFLFLKLIFSSTIAAKIYSDLFGNYYIIPVTDTIAIADFLIHGRFIICFSILMTIWVLSYKLTSFVFVSISMWLSSTVFKFLNKAITTPDKLIKEIKNDEILRKLAGILVSLFNAIDIIEINNKSVVPGNNFYKFYDYLLEIEDGNRSLDSEQFTDSIALSLQFIFIYYQLNLSYLAFSPVTKTLTIIIIISIIIIASIATAISTLVEIRHSGLLSLMEKIDPDYTNKISQTLQTGK